MRSTRDGGGWLHGREAGEHARVVRRTAAKRPAHHERYWAILRDGERFLFLGVGLVFGQGLRRHIAVAFSGKTAGVHPERRDDVLNKLDERAQHRCQPELRKRWGYQSLCAGSCLFHGLSITPARNPAGFGKVYPTFFAGRALDSGRMFFLHPTKRLHLHPTKTGS